MATGLESLLINDPFTTNLNIVKMFKKIVTNPDYSVDLS